MMLPFFALVSFRRCGPFLSCQVCWARAPSLPLFLSLSSRLHHTYVFFSIFITPQSPFVSLSSISIDFYSPLSPISLINFVSRLLYSLFPSCISIPLIKSQCAVFSFPPILLLLLFPLLCVFCHLFPLSWSKTVFSPDYYGAPGLLNGYFCTSPGMHQTLHVSVCLSWHQHWAEFENMQLMCENDVCSHYRFQVLFQRENLLNLFFFVLFWLPNNKPTPAASQQRISTT